jgi:hypothetical protein
VKQQPVPCPGCQQPPQIRPEHPAVEGDAWALVACMNADCVLFPLIVHDKVGVADDRGTDAYKAIAVANWNRAFGSSAELASARRHLELADQEVTRLQREHDRLQARAEELYAAIVEHRRLADDEKLYATAGLSPQRERAQALERLTRRLVSLERVVDAATAYRDNREKEPFSDQAWDELVDALADHEDEMVELAPPFAAARDALRALIVRYVELVGQGMLDRWDPNDDREVVEARSALRVLESIP